MQPRRKYAFVASLKFLTIDKPLGRHWKIWGNLGISNSKAIAEEILSGSMPELIGGLEVRQILSGDPFIYALADYPDEDTSEARQMDLLFTHMVQIQQFVNLLWLIKDNSVNFELGFLEFPHRRQPGFSQVSSNFMSVMFTSATGARAPVPFNENELRATISTFNSFNKGPYDQILPMLKPLGPTSDDYRLTRALYFAQAARRAWNIPEKVAGYCTSFEALVSTSNTELAHQVSERVACLIGESREEALQIYRNLKRAYDTRSKLVHGGQLSINTTRYEEESQNCDEYLRRLFNRIVGNETILHAIEGNQEQVNQYFLERIFAAGWNQNDS